MSQPSVLLCFSEWRGQGFGTCQVPGEFELFFSSIGALHSLIKVQSLSCQGVSGGTPALCWVLGKQRRFPNVSSPKWQCSLCRTFRTVLDGLVALRLQVSWSRNLYLPSYFGYSHQWHAFVISNLFPQLTNINVVFILGPSAKSMNYLPDIYNRLGWSVIVFDRWGPRVGKTLPSHTDPYSATIYST